MDGDDGINWEQWGRAGTRAMQGWVHVSSQLKPAKPRKNSLTGGFFFNVFSRNNLFSGPFSFLSFYLYFSHYSLLFTLLHSF